jgi:hypothetical protein
MGGRGAALLGGIGGTNKQLSTTQETAFPRCLDTVSRIWAGWGRIEARKIYIWVAIIKLHLTHPFPHANGGGTGWIGSGHFG